MMREIKFRGKADEWFFGDLEYNRARKIARIHYYDENGNYAGQSIVDADTVGQFTGLHDKNGRDIYEGDILDVTVFDCFDNATQYKVRVEWRGSQFIGADIRDDAAWEMEWLHSQDDEIEIIGNIYDDEQE